MTFALLVSMAYSIQLPSQIWNGFQGIGSGGLLGAPPTGGQVNTVPTVQVPPVKVSASGGLSGGSGNVPKAPIGGLLKAIMRY